MNLDQFKPVTIGSIDEYWAARAELAPIMFDADPDSADGLRAEMLANLVLQYEAAHPDIDYGKVEPLQVLVDALMSMMSDEELKAFTG